MTRSLKRTRLEQKTKALQLLTLSGAIRPADVETHYRGTDTVLGSASRPREMPRQQDSIWWMDLTDLFQAFRARQRTSRPQRRILPSHGTTPRGTAKRLAAPRAA